MNPLEVKLNLFYKQTKAFKKAQGKLLGRNIACGRNLIKILRKNYGSQESQVPKSLPQT